MLRNEPHRPKALLKVAKTKELETILSTLTEVQRDGNNIRGIKATKMSTILVI